MVGKPGRSGRREDPSRRKTAVADGIPTPPDWLKERSRSKFLELAEALNSEFGAGKIDSDMLAVYCHAYDLFARLADCELTMTDSKGTVVRHPHVHMRQQALATMTRLAGELGLTVKSRSRLPLNIASDDNDEFSEFDE